MIQFLKKYKAFLFGFSIIVPIFYLLDYLGLILLPKDGTYEIVIYAFIWGLAIALPIHYFKTKKKIVLRVLSIIVFGFLILFIDSWMKMPDNPITMFLVMGFWFGIAYILFPAFIKRYWKLLAFFYIPFFLYFVYIRLSASNFESYLEIREEIPIVLIFLPIPLLFLIWLYEQWKWIQNLKVEKANAELSLLRAQINPHFFFNTLNNLYALTVKNSKQAPEVILKLSDMMRYTIYEGEKEKVKIQDEIEYLNNYIELHKIRYKKSVEINFDYSSVDTQLTIAPLMYIILLENAFKHGVETLAEDAFISIKLYNDDDFIHFIIENNFDPSEVGESNGIGLENLRRRLTLLYEDKHELKVQSSSNLYTSVLKVAKHA